MAAGPGGSDMHCTVPGHAASTLCTVPAYLGQPGAGVTQRASVMSVPPSRDTGNGQPQGSPAGRPHQA